MYKEFKNRRKLRVKPTKIRLKLIVRILNNRNILLHCDHTDHQQHRETGRVAKKYPKLC